MQQLNVPKYVRSASNGFLYALDACWLIWSCPKDFYLFGGLRGNVVVSKILLAFSSHSKLLATLKGPVESSRTKTCLHYRKF